jgi:hypothetical protein
MTYASHYVLVSYCGEVFKTKRSEAIEWAKRMGDPQTQTYTPPPGKSLGKLDVTVTGLCLLGDPENFFSSTAKSLENPLTST